MASNDQLSIELGVTLNKLTRELAKAEARVVKTANIMEKRFKRGSDSGVKSFEKLDRAAKKSSNTMRRLFATAAGALSTREVVRYADAWTQAENKIASSSKVAGIAARSASKLNDIATETRSGITETVDLYTRLLRVSGSLGKTEAEVAEVTEGVAKAFKAGGAAATEQAAGILQIGQALGSGFLQGDELRSIRENAPLIAQAIAEEFETTIGGLKKLGAEGKLESDRVFTAILNGKAKFDAAFATTDPTIGQGFTLLRNAVIEVVGAFDDGSNASSAFGGQLANLSTYIRENIDAYERFGARVSEAFALIGEVLESSAEGWSKLFSVVSDGTSKATNGMIDDWSDLLSFIVDLAGNVIGVASGIGAAIAQGMLQGVAAVADGGSAIANGAIAAVESILNGIIIRIQKVISAINTVIESANKIPGIDLSTLSLPENISIDRVDSYVANGSKFRTSIADAYQNQFNSVKAGLGDLEKSAIGTFRRISRAGDSPDEIGDPRGNQISSPDNSIKGTGKTNRTPSSGGKKSGGRKSRARNNAAYDLFGPSQQQLESLRMEIDLLGKSTSERAKLTTKTELLNLAKKAGLDLDAKLAGTNQTLRDKIEEQANAVGTLTDAYEKAQESAAALKERQDIVRNGFDNIIDVIVSGEGSVTEAFANMARELAALIIKAQIYAALAAAFPSVFGASGAVPLAGLSNGGPIAGLASGGRVDGAGKISGAGTGTSDSILALNRDKRTPLLVSNDEGILNARAMQKYPDLLADANALRIPAYANGGPIGRVSSSGGSGTPKMEVHIHENAVQGQPQVKQSPDGTRIDVMLVGAMKKAVNGGKMDAALNGRFGLRVKGQGA